MTTASPAPADRAARHSGVDTYDNLEPWFEKMAALTPADPHRGEIRTEIMRRCLPLADHIARRFAGRGESFEDLVQVARVGLVLAVDRFDVTRGSSFLSYAVPTVMGEVRRYFRDHAWTLRVPRRLKDIHRRIGQVTPELAQRLGHSPTARELAAELEVDVEEITQAVVAAGAFAVESLDAPTETATGEEASARGELLGAEEPSYELVERALTVRPLLAALPERERKVLTLRFFRSMSQAQIGKELGMSQMHVSRVLSKTLETLREQALGPVERVDAA